MHVVISPGNINTYRVNKQKNIGHRFCKYFSQ